MSREDLAAHLEFFAELGVDGLRLEPEWRARARPGGGSSRVKPDEEPARAPDVFFQGPVPAAEVLPQTLHVARDQGGPEGPPLRAAGAGGDPMLDGLKQGPAGSAPEPAPAAATTSAAVAPVGLFASSGEALAAVRADIGDRCSRCKLHALGRSQIVFGVGNPDADLMFVGEAPGEDEDRQGEPFVGRAGQLLTKIIEAIGLERQDVYIANVIKCRPPGNRNPEPDEVEQCEPFLFRQIDIIKPKVIVALGKFAAQSLLRTTQPITRLRGREYKYRDAILMPTYHPAYLLRNPSAKREVWEDMKRVRSLLAGG